MFAKVGPTQRIKPWQLARHQQLQIRQGASGNEDANANFKWPNVIVPNGPTSKWPLSNVLNVNVAKGSANSFVINCK